MRCICYAKVEIYHFIVFLRVHGGVPKHDADSSEKIQYISTMQAGYGVGVKSTMTETQLVIIYYYFVSYIYINVTD